MRPVAKDLEIVTLLDFYGEMLTVKQRDFLEYYYNDDLSLSEIAANEGITRQGVRDAIKRAEKQLYDMEEKLGLVRRFEDAKKGLTEITEYAEMINAYNLRHSLSREINEYTVKIKAIAQDLRDQ
ncbi:MAG: DNA-binding protein [Clostridia bacterium]|nr:DNA-binding protein [Clostridia bacterium]